MFVHVYVFIPAKSIFFIYDDNVDKNSRLIKFVYLNEETYTEENYS